MNVVFLQFSGNIRCFGSAIKFDHTRVIWNARGLELVKKKADCAKTFSVSLSGACFISSITEDCSGEDNVTAKTAIAEIYSTRCGPVGGGLQLTEIYSSVVCYLNYYLRKNKSFFPVTVLQTPGSKIDT